MRYFDRRAVVLLLMSALIVVVVLYHHNKVLAGITQSEVQSQQYLSGKILALDKVEEMRLMREYYPEFQNLINNHKLVVNQRSDLSLEPDSVNRSASHRKVSWIKLLESARKQLQISDMSFEIYPYQLITGGAQELPISIGAESIVLQVSLLHDGILAELLTYLREFAPSSFVVSSVAVERSGQSPGTLGPDQITAEIVIKWHVIEVVGGRDEIAS